MTTIKQMLDELSKHMTQRAIAHETGIEQGCITRLRDGTQRDVLYLKGKRLEALFSRTRKKK